MHQQLHASRAKITLQDDDSLHQHLASESRLKLMKPLIAEAKALASSEEEEEPRKDEEEEDEEDEEIDEEIKQY
jgi:hypothetical protein